MNSIKTETDMIKILRTVTLRFNGTCFSGQIKYGIKKTDGDEKINLLFSILLVPPFRLTLLYPLGVRATLCKFQNGEKLTLSPVTS